MRPERCIPMFYHTIAEMKCWIKALENEGYIVTESNTNQICYEENGDIYDPDDVDEINCECSGCMIYH